MELRVQDVLWGENQLMLRSAKGAKDRRVPIPAGCIEPLRLQLDQARIVWEWDRKNQPAVGVPLPVRLGYKYPVAPYSWQWFWVFPAPGQCRDPLTNQTVRFHLLHDSLQRAVHKASVDAGLDYLISPHVLRHAYATHSREPIENLKELMGHWSIETTAGYRHLTVTRASNPLDDLLAASPAAPPAAIAAPTSQAPAAPLTRTPSTMPAVLHREDLAPPQRVRWKERPLWLQRTPVIA